ncbi:MHYT domain-containing protein [Marinobacter sp. F4216]|uniref:MHYT domain-containing protein n=1 Tax=Marinobacter sp. F4216 TaxID=2874281 RepID=UPI001CBA6C7E|nr:MHYT domain-containing protein [Marinobacter sp. F4216]MBZ2169682.1 diguanylate cyclase [Marinobacter sp. F4216]
MLADYDSSLVTASYVVAVLAAYTALYFGTRLNTARGEERRRWLIGGSLVMGSGVWTMHFVGMRAMPMDVPMSFDTLMTGLSWVAAVLASGLALNIISRDRVGAVPFSTAALAMASGIVVMHYLGMYAMRMSQAPIIHSGFLLLSVVIAVLASGAALAICRYLRSVEGGRVVLFQFVAALVMAAAICGMHYTGMLAFMYPEGAVPAADNGLSGQWMGIPLAVASVALLAVALVITVVDVRDRRALDRRKAEENRRVRQMAFVDRLTGLPNRAGLEQTLLDSLARDPDREDQFALIYLDMANFRDLASWLEPDVLDQLAMDVCNTLKEYLPGSAYLARYSSSAFVIVLKDYQRSDYGFLYRRLRQIDETISVAGRPITWRAGQSVYPLTGASSRKLIRAAMVPRPLDQIGHFDKVTADAELTLPGHLGHS